MTSRKLLLAVSSALAAGLLLAGCTVGPGGAAPHATSDPSSGPGSAGGDDGHREISGTLLDDGRMFAIVTRGSSSCIPQVADVTAEGQTVSVTLVEPEGEDGATEWACTADEALRASIGALPEGVDPTKDLKMEVTIGQEEEDFDLDGDPEAKATPGAQTEYAPSAGWYDDSGLVLLTWGSSTCLPVVESVDGTGSAGTVTFATDDTQVCTMDMTPRGTVIAFPEDKVDDEAPFTLTMVGGGFDGTVQVR